MAKCIYYLGQKDNENLGRGCGRRCAGKAKEAKPGTITSVSKQEFTVKTGEGSLTIRELQIPGKNPVRSRNQLVLDFSRKDAVDFIFDSITEVLDYAEVEYLKWDMNRSLCDVYSAAAGYQGKVLYDYVLGVYDFLDRLLKRYPNLLIEGCSGGGGRFDAGMLYYTPQIWCSDNTDALDRLQIQYGTSFGFPISAVGSHVSAVPNHQTGRKTPLSTRGAVAMAGTFGYELDLGNVTEEEKEEIRQQIKEYKQLAPLIQTGLYYRLSNPVTDEVAAWEFVSEDGTQAMMQAVMTQIHGNMTGNAVKWKGLEEEACYQDAESGELYYGAALMETGILLPIQKRSYQNLPDIASKSRILTQQLDMFFQHYSLAVSLEIFIIRNRNRRGEPEI